VPTEHPVPDWHPTTSLEVARLRAALLQRIRDYFAATGALEVDTPILLNAPVTDLHLESLEVRRSDGTLAGFLQTSPEYPMKRLLAAGWPDIYQVAHVFREGERGRRHNPEFTMIEWYRHGIDHQELMQDVERLLRALFAGHLELGPTRQLSYQDAFAGALDLDPLACATPAIRAALEQRGVDVPRGLEQERDALLDLAMSTLVAPGFPADRLTMLHDFPASQAALARLRGAVASRFESFLGGLELANGFHELGDPAEQERRFEADIAERQRLGRPDRQPDRRFLAALGQGLPDCSGVALGFDRVLMLAAGVEHIDSVLSFPAERA
jgi:lysyl-tRNA synthetase class 2